MDVQAGISAQRLAARVGRTLEVLVDEVHADHAVARSYADAPEIDGLVFVEGGHGLRSGQRLGVEIIAATEHDLHAVIPTAH
jgi:ribosomal protein S12 methylthiotransferase